MTLFIIYCIFSYLIVFGSQMDYPKPSFITIFLAPLTLPILLGMLLASIYNSKQ